MITRLLISIFLSSCLPWHACADQLVNGPMVGHVSSDSVRIWARAGESGTWTLTLRSGDHVLTGTNEADSRDDHCFVIEVGGLRPDTEYAYELTGPDGRSFTLPSQTVRTAPSDSTTRPIRIAFGSCAREDDHTSRTWALLKKQDPDLVVLLGDTPYIDTTDLQKQRSRRNVFNGFDPKQAVSVNTPTYFTWDDHDFGRNDTDGTMPGKSVSRKAFIEYTANPGYGDGTEGIYTSFRHGPVEIFLLDTRYFARTEESGFKDGAPSLLGSKQWDWLRKSLSDSTAPFKVIASGMIFNDAVRPLKTDFWGAYPHERDALFSFIGENRIEGVILVAGDIHRSRVVIHDSADLVGYPLTELITSPMHSSVIESANAFHPGLVKDMGEPRSHLVLELDCTGDSPVAIARFMQDPKGVLFRHEVDLPAPGARKEPAASP